MKNTKMTLIFSALLISATANAQNALGGSSTSNGSGTANSTATGSHSGPRVAPNPANNTNLNPNSNALPNSMNNNSNLSNSRTTNGAIINNTTPNSATTMNSGAAVNTNNPNQPINQADLALTNRIRQDLTSDSSLTNASRGVQIITNNGKVIVRGTVMSTNDEASILNHARSAAGSGNVVDEIDVVPTGQY